MMIHFNILCCAVLLLVAQQCSSQGARKRSLQDRSNPKVVLNDFGSYKAHSNKTVVAKGTALGHLTDFNHITLIKSETKIPAQVGDIFGIRFTFNSKAATEIPASYHVKIFHPEMQNPKTGKKLSISQWDAKSNSDQVNWVGWYFEQDWEVVPGDWTVQVSDQKDVLLSKTFSISKAVK